MKMFDFTFSIDMRNLKAMKPKWTKEVNIA